MTALRQEDDAPRGFVTMREYLRLQRRCDELEDLLADLREDERDVVDELLIHAVRLNVGVSPQGAKAIIAIARARRQPVMLHTLISATGAPTKTSVGAVVCFANKAAAERGAPLLIKGYQGNLTGGGGRYITPEGRAWLEERVPELFAKGGTP